jgi:hypothetical protein
MDAIERSDKVEKPFAIGLKNVSRGKLGVVEAKRR